jgi:hypothetical protein
MVNKWDIYYCNLDPQGKMLAALRDYFEYA